MNLSPREFQNMMTGQKEKQLDELQAFSMFALMMRTAYHYDTKKTLKAKDLFDRSKVVTEEEARKTIEDKVKKAEENMEFLQNLNLG
ncbi:TPA: hypothetical protein QCX97_003447 [Bacillus wiedmannii]|uniref:hypothetical protein n=1 Tax=Bacillus TaxID=1386 RepID=UPI0008721C30|nr:hypothetical protein [Bacillus wiedmannii]MDR4942927.1 hypothetical protein [Bacillus wiedmannii]OFC98653.1 hypothetical protein BTGOE6_52980 [Bacillus wiedmannii]HDR7669561.1 hypothetical protein [Bacillus wiedmannii]